MSGGHFDYDQYRIHDIRRKIEEAITENGRMDEPFSNDTIRSMKAGCWFLEVAEAYAQRIDWLLSGDDGEDDFHRRLAEELSKIGRKPNN